MRIITNRNFYSIFYNAVLNLEATTKERNKWVYWEKIEPCTCGGAGARLADASPVEVSFGASPSPDFFFPDFKFSFYILFILFSYKYTLYYSK